MMKLVEVMKTIATSDKRWDHIDSASSWTKSTSARGDNQSL